MRSPIDDHVRELRRCLRWHPVLARRVAAEVADHLAQAAAAGMRGGMTQAEAEEAAVRQFGPAALVAQRYRQIGAMLGRLVIAAASATTCAGIWLMGVSFVLPGRDPGTVMVWRGLATGFVAYGVLSAACGAGRADRPALRWSVGWLSSAAVVLGVLHIGSTVQSLGHARHFEGYVLLIGAILVAHGVIALAYVFRTAPETSGWRASR